MIDEAISFLEEGRVDKALEVLQEIKLKTRGYSKLGDDSSVVITHPELAPEELYDSVRFIDKACHGGDSSAKNIRVTNAMMESPCTKLFPEWFLRYAGHVDTESFCRLMYHCMVEFDLNEKNIEELPSVINEEGLLKREMALFNGEIKHINQQI